MIKKKLTAFVIMLAAVLAMAAQCLCAENDISFTVEYKDGNKAISGAQFKLYYVGETKDLVSFALTDDFKDYPVKINGLDSDGYRKLALTIEGYINRDNISPYDSGSTDKNGRIEFPNNSNELKKGLYIVTGTALKTDSYKYTPEPFVVILPSYNSETKETVYSVISQPKYDKDGDNGGGGGGGDKNDYISRKVIKVWNDKGNSANRPQSVTVNLLRNSKVYDTVKLSVDNDWRYTWDKLDADYTWTVAEKETEGYTVETDREGITFVITNTAEKPDNPVNPDNPDNPDNPSNPDKSEPSQPGSSQVNEPENPNTSEENETDTPEKSQTSKDKLPQTGMLWWPVPILAVSGLALVLIGLFIRRGADSEK